MMDKSIFILTGAGISAESGLQTFRAEDGLWCEHKVEDVATPEAYDRDPKLVQDFYNMRRAQLKTVEPNAAHVALAKLAKEWPAPVRLVTQNVDDLHGRAGAEFFPDEDYPLIHMHGELKKARHLDSGEVRAQEDDLHADDDWRPHIVWFGEMPLEMDRIYTALRQTSLFLSIGTSGNVYPAAGFFAEAKRCGAYTMEINLEPSANASYFDDGIYGPATKTVPDFVKRLLAGDIVID